MNPPIPDGRASASGTKPDDALLDDLVRHVVETVRARGRTPVILSGEIGAGKTDLARRAVQRLRHEGLTVGGILAPRRVDRQRTVGYDAVDLASGEQRIFARLTPPGEAVGRFYILEDSVQFAHRAIRHAMTRCDVVVLDEVGRWEIDGRGHAPVLRALLDAETVPILLIRDTLVEAVVAAFGIDEAEFFRVDRRTSVSVLPAGAFWEIVDSIPFPLLVTHSQDGYPQSRPMHLVHRDDHILWFPTSRRSNKVRQIAADARVTVLFADGVRFNYASLHGIADLVEDRVLAQQFWRDDWRDDWPEGPADPDYVLLRVRGIRGYSLRGATGEQREIDFPPISLDIGE